MEGERKLIKSELIPISPDHIIRPDNLPSLLELKLIESNGRWTIIIQEVGSSNSHQIGEPFYNKLGANQEYGKIWAKFQKGEYKVDSVIEIKSIKFY